MRYLAKIALTLVLSILMGAILDGARAAGHDGARPATAKRTKKVAYGGDALKAKTSLKFDGRSVEALRAGKYDSLSIGDEGAKGAKRLYNLPANFESRAAESETEMRYRQ